MQQEMTNLAGPGREWHVTSGYQLPSSASAFLASTVCIPELPFHAMYRIRHAFQTLVCHSLVYPYHRDGDGARAALSRQVRLRLSSIILLNLRVLGRPLGMTFPHTRACHESSL